VERVKIIDITSTSILHTPSIPTPDTNISTMVRLSDVSFAVIITSLPLIGACTFTLPNNPIPTIISLICHPEFMFWRGMYQSFQYICKAIKGIHRVWVFPVWEKWSNKPILIYRRKLEISHTTPAISGCYPSAIGFLLSQSYVIPPWKAC